VILGKRKIEERMRDTAKIKKKLEARLRELDQRTHEIEDEYKKPRDHDWSESAVEAEDDEVMDEIENLAIDEIKKIKIALSKIEDGTYGTCRICDKSIAAKRLEALPYATRCIDCAKIAQT
jgi:DnaK suppressor protein